MTADAHPARPPRAPSRRSLLQAGSLVLLLGTRQIAWGAVVFGEILGDIFCARCC